ncbi:HIT-like domain-containing protein [Lentinula raphanica]|uniref:HIT-like domain-containing protein n=1 Tax=Lentinula raphanica TaxID=153919 RepID=A0AA38UKE2_9AGAR|nr:HIT-like domain-containing protein [Lentinula raphanica]KAJ3844514.1 HIT-like domain-containing protein [Lentinula raphanica]
MANLFALRNYARKAPSTLPQSLLFSSSSRTLTIYDTYPKAIFHFLVLPRVQAGSAVGLDDLDSLRTLFARGKDSARDVLNALNEDAQGIKREIELEMQERYGFKWPIWIGFHSVPSMHHLHLHVISSDLCSERLKNKKHYNSFHPKLGFFLHVDDVLSWFDSEPSYYEKMIQLDHKEYEKLLKEDLVCWKCEASMKNIPTLKAHLQEEWYKVAKREKGKVERKRKMEEREKQKIESGDDPSQHTEKKVKLDD